MQQQNLHLHRPSSSIFFLLDQRLKKKEKKHLIRFYCHEIRNRSFYPLWLFRLLCFIFFASFLQHIGRILISRHLVHDCRAPKWRWKLRQCPGARLIVVKVRVALERSGNRLVRDKSKREVSGISFGVASTRTEKYRRTENENANRLAYIDWVLLT